VCVCVCVCVINVELRYDSSILVKHRMYLSMYLSNFSDTKCKSSINVTVFEGIVTNEIVRTNSNVSIKYLKIC